LRQSLGENFLDSDSECEDYTSDSHDGSENILDKSCDEDASDMSDEDFPVRREKVLQAKTTLNYEKTDEGEGRKREKTSRKYISSEDVHGIEGQPKRL